MEISDRIKSRARLCDDLLEGYLPDACGYAATVIDAMHYSLMAGGKRLRPILIMECAKLFGGAPGEVMEPFMAAMEMIHTYSLVHDDLPAMDNDDLRRGRKTTHKMYGEAMGILAGDGLLNLAFEVAADTLMTAGYETRSAKALKVLARKPGYSGMLGGQVVDIEAENGKQKVTEELLTTMYEWKTSALIEASMMIGAILAGASDEAVADMEKMGRSLGIAFQIQDDILDVCGDESKLGKPIGSDEKNEKSTYVTLFGIDAAKAKVRELSEEAERIAEKYQKENPEYDGFLRDLFEYLTERDH